MEKRGITGMRLTENGGQIQERSGGQIWEELEAIRCADREQRIRMLEAAVCGADTELVRKVLMLDPPLVDETTADGVPFALAAAGTGSLELVRYIVEYSRASMNLTDSRHRNMLHYASVSGALPVCRYLTERVGLRPDEGDLDLVTPMDEAHNRGFADLEAYFAGVLGAPLSGMYRNPIRTGMHPDPSIVRVGEDYYMVNSSFIFFPCIPISHSRDLIHWEVIGHAITNPEWARLDGLEGGRGYWAPDISYDNGTFYITATYRLNDTGTVYRRQIVVSSDRPEGPYSEPAWIDEDGIDPSIFHEDGRHYMLLNRGARLFELSSDCKRQISEAELLYYGSMKRAPEGSHLLKKDGWYYLFQAEGGTGTGHRITAARSRSLKGVYEPCPYNPIMRQEDADAPIQRCGHGKPVCTQNGEWFIPYLCGRLTDGQYSILGRETALDPITWTADGWPIVNGRRGPSTLQKKPCLPETVFAKMPCWTADGPLSMDWVSPRPMDEDAVQFEHGCLWLKANEKPLSQTDAHNILLRRQTDFEFSAWTETAGWRDKCTDCRAEYGLICYYDENTWVSCSLSAAENGKATAMVREHIGAQDIVHEAVVFEPGETVTIGVETSYLHRTFYVTDRNGRKVTAADLERVYYLCDEGIRMGKRFTGAMVGIYGYDPSGSAQAGFVSFGYQKKGK